VLAGLFLSGGYVLQTAGMMTAGSGKSGFLTAFYVSLVPLVEALVYRRLPPKRDLLALLVASAGISVMVLRADLSLSLGEGVVALSAFCWAAQIVVVGRVAERVDALRLAAIQLTVLTVVGGVGAALTTERPVEWTGELVWAVVFLGVVTNALGFLVQAWGQKRVPPTRTAILFSAEPVVAATFGVVLVGERFEAQDIAGAALVLAAVALTIWKPRPDVAPGAAGG
jgi:drug/metabolite transporter (DMT)-like permease